MPDSEKSWSAPPAAIRAAGRAIAWIVGDTRQWTGFSEARNQAAAANAALVVPMRDLASLACVYGDLISVFLPPEDRFEGLATLAHAIGAPVVLGGDAGETGEDAFAGGRLPVLAVPPGGRHAGWVLDMLARAGRKALPLGVVPAGRTISLGLGLATPVDIVPGRARAQIGRLIDPAPGDVGRAHFIDALGGALGGTLAATGAPGRPSRAALVPEGRPSPPLPLRLYGAAMSGLGLVSLPYLLMRVRRGKEDRARLGERRGRTAIARPAGRLVWIHAASVGEVVSIMPLGAEVLRRGWCDKVLVTTGTLTSAQIAERRLPPDMIHQFVPLDAPAFVRRFLDHWRPDAAILVESELWPNLVRGAHERGIPLAIANGRMSDRSFAGWSGWPQTGHALASMFELVLGQTALNARRFAMFGAPNAAHVGNLKFDVPAPPFSDADLAAVERETRLRPVWLAASTHPGEELMVAEAHIAVRDRFPDLLTIIVPRHPECGPTIVKELEARWLVAVRRGAGEIVDAKTDVYVADTIGELGLFYRLVDFALVGGSLTGVGGHNPIEPALLDCAILHGPDVGNFRDMYEAFDAAGGSVEVADAAELSRHLGDLLGNQDRVREMVAANLAEIGRNAGSLERSLDALEPIVGR